MRGKRFTILLGLGLLALPLWAVEEPVTVRLLDQATVAGPDVLLGDVARMEGESKPRLDRLQRMMLLKAAPVGKSISLTRAAVQVMLNREGYTPESVILAGAEACKVLTLIQEVTPGQLLDAARVFILAQTGEDPKNLEIKLLSPTKSLQMPQGKLEIRFRPSLIGEYIGTQILTAELSVDGNGIRVIPVRLETQAFRSVVVTKRAVKKGDKFSSDNVGIDKLFSSKASKGTVEKLGDVVGRTAGMDLKAGTPVRFSEINDPPVIHRGEVVEGLEKFGNVEITVSVRAVGDGRAGEEITVENTESHKILKARVVDENHVLIDQKKP
jgi:flagella basal body P-ring formation protein FlgA